MLEGFGIPVEKAGTSVSVQPAERLCAPAAIEVPGDISSAAYWLVAASVIADSELLLKNVGINPTRTGILDVLWAMGADITVQNERQSGGESAADLLVRTARLHGTSFGAEIMPRLIDEIPALAVAAMFADGDTEITERASCGSRKLTACRRLRISSISWLIVSRGVRTDCSSMAAGRNCSRHSAFPMTIIGLPCPWLLPVRLVPGWKSGSRTVCGFHIRPFTKNYRTWQNRRPEYEEFSCSH